MRKKTAAPTRKHQQASSPQQSGLIAGTNNAPQSGTPRCALDNRSHRTNCVRFGLLDGPRSPAVAEMSVHFGIPCRRGRRLSIRLSLWLTRLVLLGGCVVACGEERIVEPVDEPEPKPRLTAALSVAPAEINPGQSAFLTATATLPAEQVLIMVTLRTTGLGGDTTLYLPLRGPGPHEWQFVLQVSNGPIEGDISFHLTARTGSQVDSARAELRVRDDGPPKLTFRTPDVVEPPDSLSVVLEAADAAGLTDLTLRVRGAATWDATRVLNQVPQANITFGVWIPGSVALGDSAILTAESHDAFGKIASAAHRVVAVDTTIPFASVYVDTIKQQTSIELPYPLLFFPGDSVHVHIQASDNYRLSRIAFEYLSFRDSVGVDSTAAEASFHFQIPPGTNVMSPLWAIAVDQTGRRYGTQAWLSVMDGVFRPIQEVKPYPAPASEASAYALDLRRDRLYLASYPHDAVHVLGLTPLTPLPDLLFANWVASLDLSPGGDTLWVLLGNPVRLLAWDLTSNRRIDSLVLDMGACGPGHLRITANGHAIVSGRSAGSCRLLDVDLQRRTARALDVPSGNWSLASAADHRTVIATYGDHARYGADAVVYLAELGALTPVRTLFPGETSVIADPALDPMGSMVLIRHRLYDRELANYRSLLPDVWNPGIPAISWDGNTAFIGNWPGYWRLDVATAAVQERVILPFETWRLIPHPDGQRLIAFGWQWVGAVDLR